MSNALAKTKGPLTAAPPPSLTELQRRLLADSFSLDGAPPAEWKPPSVLPEPSRVRAVIAELDRGLVPTRPEFLKWICDKLSALPTQTASGLNAAIWTDNVIDVCADYPEDLLQSACLHLLRTCTFRPGPAEIVKAIDDRHAERKRMLARAKSLLPSAARQTAPAESPLATRLERLRHSMATYTRMGRMGDVDRLRGEIDREEGRATATSIVGENLIATPDYRPPYTPTADQQRVMAAMTRAPMHDAIPE